MASQVAPMSRLMAHVWGNDVKSYKDAKALGGLAGSNVGPLAAIFWRGACVLKT